MLAILAIVVQSVAALGLGLAALRMVRPEGLRPEEQLAWAFPLGVGLLGWMGFFLGLGHALALPAVAGLAAIGLGCAVALRPPVPRPRITGATATALALMLALVLLGDVLEGLAPPADADSLAYHFVLARLMAEGGGLVFEPRAVDGAIPQLTHVTYAMALLLGGERAMTLWCGLTGWMAVPLLYAVARRHVSPAWALALAALFATLPATLYAGGTGQAEPRTAAFALAATVAVAAARPHGPRWAVLAGLFAGLYAGSKYPGLLLAAAAGMVLLTQRRGLPKAVAFSVAVVAMAFQWYGWNAVQSGDPIFPLAFRWGLTDPGLWNAAQDVYFRTVFGGTETAVPKNLAWLLAYPLQATFAPMGAFDAGRIGFGPFPALALPFALAGAWAVRRRLPASPLVDVLAVSAFAYVLWFFLGPSQRVRHLLPLLPAVLLVMTVALARAAEAWSGLGRPLAAVFGVSLMVQAGGAALAQVKVVRHLATGESRAAFLENNVAAVEAAEWISANLDGRAYLFTIERQINYFLRPRHFYGNDMFQALVEIRPDNVDRRLYWRQLRDHGFTHVLVRVVDDPANMPAGGSIPLSLGLAEDHCLELVKPFRLTERQSRALPGLGARERSLHLFRLRPDTCPYGD